ncbi:hypothetical protein QBC34DRAFT_440324 [Podospora aff. communis PSN243]|uniref:Uncharacterized protein n=1 Tax=Podospora aff. communis PSN243 TaxID=3040156 RepID=A0AAV9GI77_9PEZI|nr:hypothetical protein QBC34DRAFT_440324 [Podospora aff. communis PSN243]
MARLYHGGSKCDNCRRSGHFGWVYKCIMDRDALIVDAMERSRKVWFDELGHVFAKQMSLGKFGPDRRYKKYSFLAEITEEQLHTYTPTQLGEVMTQRDIVHRRILEERLNPTEPNAVALKYPDNNRPWVPNRYLECQHRLCHYCHRLGADKSWVSLNSVVSGDIPPQAATGFSFELLGFRPEADVEVVRNIGCRAVPLPRNHPVRRLQRTASVSTQRMLGIVDERIETATCSTCTGSSFSTTSSESDDSDYLPQIAQSRGQLKHSAAVQALPRSHTDPAETDAERPRERTPVDGHSIFEQNILVRPPWTPSTSTSTASALTSGAPTQLLVPGIEGRSPLSLKNNRAVRDMVFDSLPGAKQAYGSRDHRGHGCGVTAPQIPYQTEEMCDVGLVLPVKPEVHDRACETPLPRATMEEHLYFGKSSGGTDAGPDGETLNDKKCDIVSGVALNEEAVECGTDDVVAHTDTPR